RADIAGFHAFTPVSERYEAVAEARATDDGEKRFQRRPRRARTQQIASARCRLTEGSKERSRREATQATIVGTPPRVGTRQSLALAAPHVQRGQPICQGIFCLGRRSWLPPDIGFIGCDTPTQRERQGGLGARKAEIHPRSCRISSDLRKRDLVRRFQREPVLRRKGYAAQDSEEYWNDHNRRDIFTLHLYDATAFCTLSHGSGLRRHRHRGRHLGHVPAPSAAR